VARHPVFDAADRPVEHDAHDHRGMRDGESGDIYMLNWEVP